MDDNKLHIPCPKCGKDNIFKRSMVYDFNEVYNPDIFSFCKCGTKIAIIPPGESVPYGTNEQYAVALERLAATTYKDPKLGENDNPLDFALYVASQRMRRKGLQIAAAMLRMSPMELYTNYPDCFPMPPKDGE